LADTFQFIKLWPAIVMRKGKTLVLIVIAIVIVIAIAFARGLNTRVTRGGWF